MATGPARHGIYRAERVGGTGGRGPEEPLGLAERRKSGGGGGERDVCARPRSKADRVAELTETRAAATAVSTPLRTRPPHPSVRVIAPVPNISNLHWSLRQREV